MRIDGLSNTPASNSANIADLLGRLDTGDVIKAKVLEITPNEVVLRLFDGSVLKAATAEGLEAKVGQTLTLSVTSKAEGTLFLETVKDPSQLSNIKPHILKNMLEGLQIKPDAKNMALAAEFMKAGITISTALIDKAAGLMESFKGLNAEKAVFITSKGLQTDQNKLEFLTKLLDGDIKVGDLLKELQTTLNNISRTIGKNSTNAALTRAIFEAVESALALNSSTSSTSSTAINTSSAASTIGQAAQQGIALNSTITEAQTSPILNKTASNPSVTVAADMDTTINAASGKSTSAVLPEVMGASAVVKGSQESAALSSKVADLGNLSASTAATASNTDNLDAMTGNNAQTINNKGEQLDSNMGNASTVQRNSENVSGNEPVNHSNQIIATLQDDNKNTFENVDSRSTDPLAKLKDAIKELFVNISSDKLASELDVNKMQKDLNNKLDMIKAAIQTSNLANLADGKGILATTSLIDDSVKLLNQLNNNNMLYYQLPVNLSGYNTTAELYVMKRQQSKKRIDPHNTVMFVSLDTKNLGRVETLLDVKGNNVSINLRTEKKQINEFVKENIKYLYSGLADCGYKLVDIRYALIDFATPPVKLEQLLSKMVDSNYSKVDMRI